MLKFVLFIYKVLVGMQATMVLILTTQLLNVNMMLFTTIMVLIVIGKHMLIIHVLLLIQNKIKNGMNFWKSEYIVLQMHINNKN